MKLVIAGVRGLIQIALGRSSARWGALCASKTLARFVERGSNPPETEQDKKRGRKGLFVFVWYSLGDLNPCYRRERAAS